MSRRRPLAIEFEDESPPFVLGLGATLKRAAAQPKLGRRLLKMKGVLALRSVTDSQAATVRFERGRIRLSGGVADDAAVIISLDLNASGDAGPKPKVKGALRHPLLALGAAKVLEPPAGTWQQEAAAFWEFAKDARRMPSALLVVRTDEGTEARASRRHRRW